jgi:hypothetical protein
MVKFVHQYVCNNEKILVSLPTPPHLFFTPSVKFTLKENSENVSRNVLCARAVKKKREVGRETVLRPFMYENGPFDLVPTNKYTA